MSLSFIGLVVFVILVVWGINKAYQEFYLYADKKPFWKGTELVKVCKKPYYSSDSCRKLKVTLVDNQTVKIPILKGGYMYLYNLECKFAGQPRFVVCSSRDSYGEQWDLMPVWVDL